MFPGARFDDDAEGQRDRIIRQLVPPLPARDPAPDQASVELKFAGERVVGATGSLVPGVPGELHAEIPFAKLRDAALRDRGVEARLRWGDDDEKRVGRVQASAVLAAFHGPIEITGLQGSASTGWYGTLRIPDRLTGFTLRASDGRWSIAGVPTEDGVLCSPCQKGRNLEVRIEGIEVPVVSIVEAGYPGAGSAAGDWLRALRGDNRAYLEMGGESGG